MSLLTLPEPANWPAGGRRLRRLSLILALFFAAAAFFGVRSLLRGDYLEAVVGVGFLLPLILAVIALQLVSRGRTSLRACSDRTGTLLRADRTFSRVGLAAFGVFIPVGLVFVTFTLTGDLRMFPSQRGQTAAVVLAALTVGIAITGLLSAWRRGGIGYVKLTPAGIDIANIKSTESVDWDDVTAVADHSEVNAKTRKAIVLRLRDGTEKTIDGADFYVPQGVGLYWMVRHYWRHADDRAEFTDSRALQRLSDGRFDLD